VGQIGNLPPIAKSVIASNADLQSAAGYQPLLSKLAN
jgi:hypothetical protein